MTEGKSFKDAEDSALNGEDSNSKDNICRDFLRNVCKRGKLCKFKHPEGYEAEALGKKDIVFCHDFQNKECRRPNCKFVHCTKQEEEIFRSTGRLPETVLESMGNAGYNTISKIPICKDYLKGECRRAGRCKFRHMSNYDFQMEASGQNNRMRRDHIENDRFDNFNGYEPQPKRRAYENTFSDAHYPPNDRKPMVTPHYLLEEENAMLLHKIEELKKQVLDLTATNEFLLDQNAQLRVSKQTLVSPISQQLIPHTLTPTMSSLPPPSITQLSQIPLSTDLGAASLAPDLTLTPVSIAPSQVTLPTISAASLSQSLPQTIITSTALISYPIMTQSMRPVIPHSLG
ncbi:zinc finger CCCH domain-containing protein 10-like [Argiope bruennichi]|uniref:zinc finger CCCH domain-containing protein 10-like n=1 Tax=Argiope bruennichi TaxID=94029 RepID=UPI0024956594|nr:zinc finger CCCH domain-containing protein 10-like [Argiope bruennichi]